MHIKEHSRFDFMDTEDGLLGMKLYVKDVSKNFSAKVHEDLRKYAEKYALQNADLVTAVPQNSKKYL